MKKIIITAVLTSFVFIAGFSVGQNENKFEKYSEPYTPTLAEWKAVAMTAYENNEDYLTAKLIRKSLQVYRDYPNNKILWLRVDTRCQPEWDVYLGSGSFSISDSELRAAYQKAVVSIMRKIKIFYPEYGEENITITFYIKEDLICEYSYGKMLLKGEIKK